MEHVKKFTTFVMIVAAASFVDFGGMNWVPGEFNLIPAAEARVGRPLTPVSAGGVARRTTRRVVRRGAIVYSLPAGCVAYPPYYKCGGVYYEPTVQNNTTVYVTVELED